MRGCLRFFAGVLAVLFVITAVLALFLTNLITVVADRDIIKESLANLDRLVVEAVPALVVQTLEEQARAQGLAPIDLDEAVLQQSVESLLPPGWIETQTATAVDLVYDMLESGNPNSPELVIDISPLQERFRGEPGKDVVGVIINALPPCANPVNPVELFNGATIIPACLPPGVPDEQIIDEAHGRLVQIMENSPPVGDEFGLIRVPLFSAEQQARNQEFAQARAQLLRLQQLFSLAQDWGWLLWLLPIGCLLAIAVLAVRSWSDWGHWWGWPLLITAFLVLFVALIFPAITMFLLRQLPADPAALTTTLQQTAVRLVTAVTDTWMNRVTLQAGIMLLAGVLFILVGVLSGGRGRVQGTF